MDDSNLHTSVVIEVADEETPEDQKTYKIELNNEESPKNFVIDEIFCGENITVYALFEISDVSSVKSGKKLIEVSNSVTKGEDYKFFHRNSYKNGEIGRVENGCGKTFVNSEANVLLNKNKNTESLYCLRHFEEGYSTETSEKTEDSNGLKVLYSKDFHKNSHKFKSVSRGINTEIAQSPKLLEEVQQAVQVKFPFVKCEQKKSVGCFDEIIEIETRISSSRSNSDANSKNFKKSTTNFLIVPFVVMEEGVLSQLKSNEKSLKFKQDVVLAENSADVLPEKISLGINTDATDSCVKHLCQEKKIEIREEITQTLSEAFLNIAENVEAQHQLHTSKETILAEVKNLQLKLNTLIQSLEMYKIDLKTKESQGNSEISSPEKETKEQVKKIEIVENIQESSSKSQTMLDIIPFPLPHIPSAKHFINKNTQKLSNLNLKSDFVVAVRSKSSTIISSRSLSSVSQIIIKEIAPPPVKEANSEVFINWKTLENWKGLGFSKSESVNRNINLDLKPLNHSLKKSLSFDLKIEKQDALSIKKIKNLCCKLEPSNAPKKAEMRIIQEILSPLGDNVIIPKNEMGDEILKNQKIPRPDFLEYMKKEENNEVLGSFKRNDSEKKESHKEEGDAKITKNLINPNYIHKNEKLIVQFCTNTTRSENLLKNQKITPQKGKSKNSEKSTDKALKVNSDSSNTNTINKKITIDEKGIGKKEKKMTSKTVVKGGKTEKNESHEIIKPKSLSGSRKLMLKSTAESKLHVNKLIKKSENGKVETGGKVAQETNSLLKNTSKSEGTRLPRLLSQKRDRRDTTSGDSRTSSKNEIILSKNSQNKEGRRKCAEVKEKELMMLESNESNEEDSIPLTSSNPSSVIVELFLKKPTSVDDFYSEADQECLFGTSTLAEYSPAKKKSKELSRVVSQTSEKPIVKSVWALTKVLLFEDGTKKLEILEASLTPPGCYFK